MKKLSYSLIFLLINTQFFSLKNDCKTKLFDTKSLIIIKLEQFIKEKKFQADEALLYPGINNKNLRAKLTELINESAKDFIQVINNNGNDENYQAKIKLGVARFETYFTELGSEDLDRIYLYYEQLIKIVELKNTGDDLKNWRYGVTPKKK